MANARELYAAMVDVGLSMSQAKALYRDTLGSIAERFARSPVVDIPGVGAFIGSTTHHPARQGVNPFTRQPITWPARTSVRVHFEPDGALVGAIVTQSAGAQASDPLHVAFASVLTKWGLLNLPGVGSFRLVKIPARRAQVDPRTGAVVKPAMPASRDVRFRPTSKLKRAVLGEDVEQE